MSCQGFVKVSWRCGSKGKCYLKSSQHFRNVFFISSPTVSVRSLCHPDHWNVFYANNGSIQWSRTSQATRLRQLTAQRIGKCGAQEGLRRWGLANPLLILWIWAEGGGHCGPIALQPLKNTWRNLLNTAPGVPNVIRSKNRLGGAWSWLTAAKPTGFDREWTTHQWRRNIWWDTR